MNNFGLGLVGATLEGGFLLSPLVVDTVENTGLRLRAIYDLDLQEAREAELLAESKYAQVNIPQDIYLTSDFQHLFNDFMLDVMLIASPADEHRAMVESTLAGFDKIALQSPLALNMEDAQAIVDASRETPILVNMPRRYEAAWLKAYELLQSGVIGNLQFINLRVFLPETNYLRLWQRTKTGRDELFLGQLCNYMDVFNWFSGAACVQVSGIGGEGEYDLDDYDPNGPFKGLFNKLPVSWRSAVSKHRQGVEVDDFPADHYMDHAAIQLLYSNQVLGSLMVTSHGPAAMDAEDLELVGDKGRIWLNAQEGKIYIHFWEDSVPERIENLGYTQMPLWSRLNAAFLQYIPYFIEGYTVATSAVEGAEALKLALVALDSIQKNGQPVLLDLEIEGEALPEIEEEADEGEPLSEVISEIEVEIIETLDSQEDLAAIEEVDAVVIEVEDDQTGMDAVDAVTLETEDDWEEEHPAVEIIEEVDDFTVDGTEAETETEIEAAMTDWPIPLDDEDEAETEEPEA